LDRRRNNNNMIDVPPFRAQGKGRASGGNVYYYYYVSFLSKDRGLVFFMSVILDIICVFTVNFYNILNHIRSYDSILSTYDLRDNIFTTTTYYHLFFRGLISLWFFRIWFSWGYFSFTYYYDRREAFLIIAFHS